jgi:creatinine amidohydrolase
MAARGADRQSPPRPDDNTQLGVMRSADVSTLFHAGPLDVVVPLGALEQHGPHLPLSTDSIIVEAVARELARRETNLIVAPCLPIGASSHHAAFAGTVSLSEGTIVGYVHDAVRSLLAQGFRYAFLISGHAGNMPIMSKAVSSLPAGLRQRVGAYVDWPAQRKALHDWATGALGLTPEEVGSHAGHFETSIMLYLAPERVNMEAAPVGFIGPVEEATSTLAATGMRSLSSVGVVGDPRGATEAAGKEYFEVFVKTIHDFIVGYWRRASGGS